MTARRERAALGAMIAATLLWGGTFVAIRDSVRTLSPAALVCGRFAIAAGLFAIVGLLRGHRPDARTWRVGIANGALMACSFTLQAIGLRTTSAGSSAFLTCAGTLLAALYAWPLLRQKPTPVLIAGIALAMAGSALMSLDGALKLGRGELITLLGATFYALQVVLVARFARDVDAIALTGVQGLTVAVLVAPFAGDLREAYASLRPSTWAAFAYLVVAGSSLAPLLQVWAQRSLSAGRVGLLFALEPVFALVFALLIGAERFQLRWWLGAALILIAVVIVEAKAAMERPDDR